MLTRLTIFVLAVAAAIAIFALAVQPWVGELLDLAPQIIELVEQFLLDGERYREVPHPMGEPLRRIDEVSRVYPMR